MAFDGHKTSHHASPLRYPGGKAKLAPYIKQILRQNRLLDCTYAEPFGGGAGAGLSLLLRGYVKHVVINDLSTPIHAFWHCALNEPDYFCDRIKNANLDTKEWERQRQVFLKQDESDILNLGFATFYLNRTNHSGVLNGGMIGGKAQKSSYGIDARFNREELIGRIRRLQRHRSKISIHKLDANEFLSKFETFGHGKSLIYIDPPYYVKGRDLYYDFYNDEDHIALRDNIKMLPSETNWIVSYDNVEPIRRLYSEFSNTEYDLGYSVRNGGRGREVMFFSPGMTIPELATG